MVPVVGHSGGQASASIDGGKMDGFAKIPECDQSRNYQCYSEYDPTQIPNLAALARKFDISDRTFEYSTAPSWASHVSLVADTFDGFNTTKYGNPHPKAGVTVGAGWGCDSNLFAYWQKTAAAPLQFVPSCIPAKDGSGSVEPSPVAWVPTIMDRMDAAGESWRIYSGAYQWAICPSFAECLNGPQRTNFIRANDAIINDASAGTLPALSIVIPTPDASQHNGFSMLAGDNWIGQVVGAIENGPNWGSTAIFVTYDDCGCFYDHVPPPGPNLGIRVPMVIVSPYAKAHHTDSTIASTSSILAFIDHTFGLTPLSARENGYDYHWSFNFSQAPLSGSRMRQRSVPLVEERWIHAHRSPGLDDT